VGRGGYDLRVNIIFIEPAFPANQREFLRGLAAAGATVIGIGERPIDALDPELRDWMLHYQQIGNVTDVGALVEAVRFAQSKVWIDALESTIEAHTMAAAQAREACGIPGTSVRTAYLCRDKPSMKEVLREAGVPTAMSTAAHNAAEVRAFAVTVGYPLILKPRAAAGASGTSRVDSDADLDRALAALGASGASDVAVEEFVEGHEGFYDTISIDGRPAYDFISHYYPNVLEAMRERWISPQFIATNRVDTVPDYGQVRDLGLRAIEALGIGTSATHMEWFFGPKGLRFSEIGCRPPGVRAWDLYAAGNDIDIYREWANAIVHSSVERPLSRRRAAGIVALRPDRDGTITHYEGVDEMQREFGEWIIDAHLPGSGTPTQPVEAGYMANAWVRMAHPDYDTVHHMLNVVGETVHVHAS
jgi:formate-dependent phosphoribosylglycinamide formyltransferase (GAR transformylase)